jgi:hypothetical protein
MPKSRDLDAELRALQDKQRSLKLKRIAQFSGLVTATGADALDAETLAGVLLDAVERAKAGPSTKEAWQRKGDSFFRRERPAKSNGAGDTAPGATSGRGGAVPNHNGVQPG